MGLNNMTNSVSSNGSSNGQSGVNSGDTNVHDGVEPKVGAGLPGSIDASEKNNGIHDYATSINKKTKRSNVYYKSYPYCIPPSTFIPKQINYQVITKMYFMI